MSIWDTISEVEYVPEENTYLEDDQKAIELIACLLKRENDREKKYVQRNISKLDALLDKQLLFSLKTVDLADELELYDKILTLSDKLNEQNRLVLLKEKVVVGVGGKFSAGKSCFINSLLNLDENILPENQDETTSIATYVLRGEERKNYAYTYDNQAIELDDAAIDAMCHQFKRKYEIGFAGFISNIAIQLADFPYDKIALLDTPGYSKADSGILKEMSDESKAREQLRTIDYLIWLIDVGNGVVLQKDIEFIRGLKIDTPILVVVNKSDKKPESALREIVNSAKMSLEQGGIDYFDVIAYSSRSGEEYLDNNGLERFMEMINSSGKIHEDIKKEINELIGQILDQLRSRREAYIKQAQDIGDVIFRSTDSLEIRGLVEVYADIQNEIRDLDECIKCVYGNRGQIQRYIERIGL